LQYLARYAIKWPMENNRPKDPYSYFGCSIHNTSGDLPTKQTEKPKEEKPSVGKSNRKNSVFEGSTVHFALKELPH